MRHILAGGGAVLALAVLGTFPFLFGGGSQYQPVTTNEPPAVAQAAVPFTTLAQGDRSKVARRTNYLITSRDQLSELWKMLDTTTKPPSIDFTTEAVIAVFAGEEPTAGHAIAVSKIEDSQKRIVLVSVYAPGEGCMTAETITTPYQVLKVPRTDLSYTHSDAVVPRSCR
ncbi:MAG: protease complex subunit PrcB family protein [Candidatus Paceibacterota bacterium]|jgi:hypothetical protein